MYVVYQPDVGQPIGHFLELTDIQAEELRQKCVSTGHVVCVASDPIDALQGFSREMLETVNIQGLFTPNTGI